MMEIELEKDWERESRERERGRETKERSEGTKEV